jgi:2-isopropylmalate synthase
MPRERLYLFYTTLRDGAKTNGVDFTLHDKQLIAGMLDELGIDYVEGGYPGANPTDTEFFAAKPKLEHARFTAFGMTRRPGRSASNDPGLAALLEAKADAICFVAKSSAYQVRVALETTNEENLASIRDSVKAAKNVGREVMLDCEHFFDGYKERQGGLRFRRALGGAVRHQWRHHAARGRDHRHRSDKTHSRRPRRHPCP